MPLKPDQFQELAALVTDAFSESDLQQLVKFKLGADMYKEWVADGKPLKDIAFDLINKLEEIGMTVRFLEAVLEARPGRTDVQTKVNAIQASLTPSGSADGQVEDVRSGIREVGTRLADAAMRKVVLDLREILHKLADDIGLLYTYKSLHDALHNLQMQLRSLANAARNLRSDALAPADLVQSITQLRTLRSSIEAAIDSLPEAPPYRGFENAWLAQLDRAVTLAEQASANADPAPGREGVQEIKSILRREPSRIDRSLSMTADALQLNELKNLFAKARTISGQTDAERERFSTRAMAAEQLLRQLKALVNQHTQWQDAEGSLWEAEELVPKSSADDPSDFDAIWSGIKRRVTALVEIEPQSPWAKTIAQRHNRVDEFRRKEDWPNVGLEFARFRQESVVRFFAVDTSLRLLADKVNAVGESLSELLTQVQP